MIDDNSKAIIDAINSGNTANAKRMDKQQGTLEAQQVSINKLANSIHELAMTANFLRKDIDANEQRSDKEIAYLKKTHEKENNIIHARIDRNHASTEKKLDNINDELKDIVKIISSANTTSAVSNAKVVSMWTVSQKAVSLVIGLVIIGGLAAYGSLK